MIIQIFNCDYPQDIINISSYHLPLNIQKTCTLYIEWLRSNVFTFSECLGIRQNLKERDPDKFDDHCWTYIPEFYEYRILFCDDIGKQKTSQLLLNLQKTCMMCIDWLKLNVV